MTIPPDQANDRERHIYKEIGAIVNGRNCIALRDFNSLLDFKNQTSTTEGMIFLEFVDSNFLTKWVREPKTGKI